SGMASSTTSLGGTAPASIAEEVEFRDADEPGIGSTDIRRVVVLNSNRWVHVWVKQAGRRHAETRLWIDSVKADPGPEYMVGGYQNSEFFGSRVERFGDPTRATWQCNSLRMQDDGTSRWVHFVMRPACLRGPGHIRVHADSKGNGARDHAPDNSASGHKRFYDWVMRG
nr:hypothetical protein [Nocardioidaceae bacterium]